MLTIVPTTFLDKIFSQRSERLGARFDRLHGVETSEVVGRHALTGMPTELREHAGDYVPTNPSLFRRIVRKSGVDPAEFTFVDLGCGKGRVLIAASDFPFRSLIGVEADARLFADAERNLQSCLNESSRARVTVVHEDARRFDYPDGDLFVFMFGPFRGPVFEAVARRLAQVADEPHRALVIAYSADFEGDVLERTGRFMRRRLRRRQFWAPSSVSLFFNVRAEQMRRSRK